MKSAGRCTAGSQRGNRIPEIQGHAKTAPVKYKDKMFLNSCCPNRKQESKMERVCVNKTGEPCLVMLFPKSSFFLRPTVTLKLC